MMTIDKSHNKIPLNIIVIKSTVPCLHLLVKYNLQKKSEGFFSEC